MARTGLEEFREVIADFKSLTSWTVKGAVVAPFADLVLRVGAPWPDGVPVITSILELITLICVFHFWFGKSHKQLTKLMKVFLVIVSVSFFGHLYLLDTYTFVSPASSKRYAKGFRVLPNVQRLIPTEFKTADEVLHNSEYKEEDVWTAGSITAARLVLLAVWLTMFASLSALIATFIMAQRRRTVKAPPRRHSTKKKQPVIPPPAENVKVTQSAQRTGMVVGLFILQLALLATGARAQWNAQTVASRMAARVITVNSWPNEPVKIVAVKLRGGEQIKSGDAFQGVDDWVRGLTLTVTNVSQKPVCFIHVQLLLPRPPDDAGARPASDALMFVCNPVTAKKPKPLMPGLSIDIVMRDSDYIAHEALLERYQYPPVINKLELKVLEVEFFGMKDRKWSKGQMMRQDPNSPGEWYPVSP